MTELTKRGVLCKLVKVYDPLSLVSPLTLEGKLIFRACLHGVGDPGLVGLVSFVFTYPTRPGSLTPRKQGLRDVCDEKQPWDAKLKEPTAQRWKK